MIAVHSHPAIGSVYRAFSTVDYFNSVTPANIRTGSFLPHRPRPPTPGSSKSTSHPALLQSHTPLFSPQPTARSPPLLLPSLTSSRGKPARRWAPPYPTAAYSLPLDLQEWRWRDHRQGLRSCRWARP
jgi:hypothetical protein